MLTFPSDLLPTFALRWIRSSGVFFQCNHADQHTGETFSDNCGKCWGLKIIENNGLIFVIFFFKVDSLVKISTEYLHKIQPHLLQKFIRVPKGNKAEELLKVVKRDVAENRPVMIFRLVESSIFVWSFCIFVVQLNVLFFSNDSATSNWICHFLNDNGIKCIRANGEMDNADRLSQFQEFRLGYVNVISCTDLTSRGLDTTRVIISSGDTFISKI